jgi:hypothetical protein
MRASWKHLRLTAAVVIGVMCAFLVPSPASPTGLFAAPLSARLSAQSVTVNHSLVVSGSTRPGRQVTLDWLRAGAWQRVRTTTADSAGAFQISVPTWWLGGRSVRVSAAGSSSVISYDVHPSYDPSGSADLWNRYPGDKYWDPCKPISWVFNPAGGYTGSLRTITRAIQYVSEATGITFRYLGRTNKVAFRDTPRSAGAKLLISWATPQQVPRLAGSVVGSAGSDSGWDGYYKHGQVVLDRTQNLRPGFHTSGGYDWGQVMLHELGHIMGLRHVASTGAIMYGETSHSVHRYTAGDLGGLRAVGAARPCA